MPEWLDYLLHQWWFWIFVAPELALLMVAAVAAPFIASADWFEGWRERRRERPEAARGDKRRSPDPLLLGSLGLNLLLLAGLAVLVLSPTTLGVAEADDVERIAERPALQGPQGARGFIGSTGARGLRGPVGGLDPEIYDEFDTRITAVDDRVYDLEDQGAGAAGEIANLQIDLSNVQGDLSNLCLELGTVC